MFDDQTNTRIDSLYSGRDRIPPRTFYSASGEAIPFDGFFGSDGLPVSIQNGRVFLPQEGREGRKERWSERVMLSRYRFSVAWVTILVAIGVYFQGWH